MRRHQRHQKTFYPATCTFSPSFVHMQCRSSICTSNANGRRPLPSIGQSGVLKPDDTLSHADTYWQSSVCAHTARMSDLLFNLRPPPDILRSHYGYQCHAMPCHGGVNLADGGSPFAIPTVHAYLSNHGVGEGNVGWRGRVRSRARS
jgi:hypothetical protein